MGEWKEYKLGEIYNFASGLSKSRKEFGFGYEFLSFKDVFHNFFIPDKLTQLANTTEQERKRCSIKKGDVFLTRTSETQEELGMSSVALKDYPTATFNGFTKRLRPRNPSLVLPEYAGFYFRSPRFRVVVTSMASITTRASLNNGMLSDLTITIPPMEIQKAIASVLSSLDDKIDLLHRQNKTLEAMAETLFRQWFVEGAKEGWGKEEKLRDIVQFIKGRKPNDAIDIFVDGLVPQILIETFDTGKTLFSKPQNMVIAEEKDILMVMDGASSGRVEIGFEGIVGSTIGLFKPIDEFNFPLFLFYFLKINEKHIKDNTTGSAIPHTDKALVLDLDLNYSNIEKIKEFEQISETWFNKKQTNQSQIRTLEKLRDTLLPKLISGQIRIKNFENVDGVIN